MKITSAIALRVGLVLMLFGLVVIIESCTRSERPDKSSVTQPAMQEQSLDSTPVLPEPLTTSPVRQFNPPKPPVQVLPN